MVAREFQYDMRLARAGRSSGVVKCNECMPAMIACPRGIPFAGLILSRVRPRLSMCKARIELLNLEKAWRVIWRSNTYNCQFESKLSSAGPGTTFAKSNVPSYSNFTRPP
jgi:hypothetical protein